MAGFRKSLVLFLVLGTAAVGQEPDPADAAMASKDWKTAIRILEERIMSRPGDAALRQKVALAYARIRRCHRAVAHLKVARNLSPADPGILFDLAANLSNQGLYAEALPVWRDLESMAHQHPILLERPDAAFQRGNAAAKLELVPEAVEALTRAVNLAPRDLAMREILAGTLLNARRNEEAITQFEELVRQAPHSSSFHYLLATAQMAVQDDAAAEKSLREARRLDPKDFRIPEKLGRLFQRQRKFDHALSLYLEAHELNPASAEACYGISRAYASKGDQVLADEWQTKYEDVKKREDAANEELRGYNRRIANDPKDVTAHLGLLELYVRNQNFVLAQTVVVGLLAADPDHEVGIMNMASLLARRGDFEGARWELDKILERKPAHPFANLELGRLLLMQSQWKAAAGPLATAAREIGIDDPRHPEATDMAVEAALRSGAPESVFDLVLESAKGSIGMPHETRIVLRLVQVAQACNRLDRAFAVAEAAFPRLDVSRPEGRSLVEFLASYAEKAGLVDAARTYRERLTNR